ncbi:MAG TPA: homocysteine S-methyltransferase family protein, partial [Actinomycetota bacterium]|nr:homocysteine S-methyltransferase family protein [Actinomycetota bacterium]
LERRGYIQAGAFVPEAVLDHPEKVTELHREFVHAGSDVVEAFTYYAHREKMRIVGKEDRLEELNRQALALAKEVADETGTLFAGDICNTNVFDPDDAASKNAVRAMFEEQVGWAAEAGVDFVIAETFSYAEETKMAVEAIKAAGLPAVATMIVHQEPETRDGLSLAEACAVYEQAGADVVGLNCGRGPRTMLPLLPAIVERVSCHVAALPVPYRTHEHEPTFQSLTDPHRDGMAFPTALEPLTCNRYELAEFATEAAGLGVNYIGICCGNAPHFLRSLAEALGRTPPASRYSPDMSKHAYFGDDPTLKAENRTFAERL